MATNWVGWDTGERRGKARMELTQPLNEPFQLLPQSLHYTREAAMRTMQNAMLDAMHLCMQC